MFEAFKKLKLASAFLGCPVAPGNTGGLSASDIFGDLTADKLEVFGGDIDAIFEIPGVAQLYENGYMPPPERPDVLLDLPEETLGYQFGCYLKQHKLTIEAPGTYKHGDRLTYLRERVRMLHPLVHVLTMYDTSPLGELAVQAFFVGQFANLASGTILAAGLLRLIQDTPQQLGDALQLVAEAFERGRDARNVLEMPWEELFPASSMEIRDLFGLSPRTSNVALLTIREEPLTTNLAEQGSQPEPEPTPEPESAPARHSSGSSTGSFSSSMSFGGSGRPKTRWAGLDHLSDAEPAPEPAPEPKTPRRGRNKPEPSGLARALSEHTAKAAAAKAERTAKAKATREAKAAAKPSGLASFFEAVSAGSMPTPPPAPAPPQLDLRGPPRPPPPRLDPSENLPSQTEVAKPPSASKLAAALAKATETRARAETNAEAKTEGKTKAKQSLPKPGDRDYF